MDRSISTQRKGQGGPVSGAPIIDGRYSAVAKDGVPVGTHRVKVEGYRPRGANDAGDDMLAGMAGAPVQYIPPQFNTSTQLEVVIPGDKPKHVYNIDLTVP